MLELRRGVGAVSAVEWFSQLGLLVSHSLPSRAGEMSCLYERTVRLLLR